MPRPASSLSAGYPILSSAGQSPTLAGTGGRRTPTLKSGLHLGFVNPSNSSIQLLAFLIFVLFGPTPCQQMISDTSPLYVHLSPCPQKATYDEQAAAGAGKGWKWASIMMFLTACPGAHRAQSPRPGAFCRCRFPDLLTSHLAPGIYWLTALMLCHSCPDDKDGHLVNRDGHPYCALLTCRLSPPGASWAHLSFHHFPHATLGLSFRNHLVLPNQFSLSGNS